MWEEKAKALLTQILDKVQKAGVWFVRPHRQELWDSAEALQDGLTQKGPEPVTQRLWVIVFHDNGSRCH